MISGQKQEDSTRWAISQDGRYLVSVKPDGPRFFDLLSGQFPDEKIGRLHNWIPSPLDRLGKDPMVAACSKASSAVVLSNWIHGNPELGVFNPDTGKLITVLRGHIQPAASIILPAQGDIVFTGGNDPTVRVWDIQDGRCLNTLSVKDNSYRPVYAFRTSPTADQDTLLDKIDPVYLKPWRIVIHYTFGAFAVLDAATGRTVHEIYRSPMIREDLIGVFPDGYRALATSGYSFWIFDVRTGGELKAFHGHTDIAMGCAFHAGVQMAISGQWMRDQRLWVWDLASGQVIAKLDGHTDQIKAVAFSADGSLAISGNEDKTIRIWDLKAMKCLHTLHLDAPAFGLSQPLANGVFIVSMQDTSLILKLNRDGPEVVWVLRND